MISISLTFEEDSAKLLTRDFANRDGPVPISGPTNNFGPQTDMEDTNTTHGPYIETNEELAGSQNELNLISVP